ncbi:MAG TPA: dTDP-4-dehydrorhamnose reductase [Gaiellaceae bacterium]|nr:dTDP-4-dehydrorhamnose reductase [Gaiellaceae bacterium]
MTGERVLVTGGGGQLSSELEEALAGVAAEVHAPARAALDITEEDAVAAVFADFRPTVVFNCAAFHNVDVCEREEDRAFEVNARAVKRLAQRCAEQGTRLVHMSTNYVFDGTAEAPYREDDLPSPKSIYAISKLAGEYAALAYAPGALVARSAGLYGLFGSVSKGGNFVTRMLGRAREQGLLRVVVDQRLSPTFTSDLAAGLIEAVERGVTGVVHLTNGGACSWHEFTETIMELAGVDVPVERITTTRGPGEVDRPLNGVLAAAAAERAGLTPLRDWRDALEDYMDRAGLLAAARA